MTDQQTDHAWDNRSQILASLDPNANATASRSDLGTPIPGDDPIQEDVAVARESDLAHHRIVSDSDER